MMKADWDEMWKNHNCEPMEAATWVLELMVYNDQENLELPGVEPPEWQKALQLFVKNDRERRMILQDLTPESDQSERIPDGLGDALDDPQTLHALVYQDQSDRIYTAKDLTEDEVRDLLADMMSTSSTLSDPV